ncbi:unnamed protein product [Onchocerca ochengi]|uniref:V-type proton ATPase subunit D n=1 Tax=Onchocerca ochengi TaxID=42157 RepID=A0A182E930_ONCOC|nr:unnamed protein product [Onchocerca ochengi]
MKRSIVAVKCALEKNCETMHKNYGQLNVKYKMMVNDMLKSVRYVAAMPTVTGKLFKKQTAVFEITNPIYMENIRGERVLSMVEDVINETIDEILNGVYGTVERRRRIRRMLQEMPTLIEKRKRNRKADQLKTVANRSHLKQSLIA